MYFFETPFEKTELSLKSDSKNGYFTRRPINIYDSISLKYTYGKKYFRHTL